MGDARKQPSQRGRVLVANAFITSAWINITRLAAAIMMRLPSAPLKSIGAGWHLTRFFMIVIPWRFFHERRGFIYFDILLLCAHFIITQEILINYVSRNYIDNKRKGKCIVLTAPRPVKTISPGIAQHSCAPNIVVKAFVHMAVDPEG